MNRRDPLIVLLLMLTATLCAGCLAVAAAGAAGGGVLYVQGDLETNLDAPPDRVTKAAEAALQDQGITVLSNESSSLDGKIVARTAQDKKITIKVRRLTDATSHISIRVGTFGSQSMSQAILDKIKENL